jgi:hypothetical protein
MKEKIKLWYAEKFSSSPIKISDKEIEFVIARDCECDNCGESIFEMSDFPEINIENDELLCEKCYDHKYKDTCVICEEVYDLSDLPTEFPKSPFYYIGPQNKSGIYHALEWPVFSAACGGLGDTYIWWNSVEFVCSMEDFLNSHDPELKYDFSEKWKEFLENNNIEYADYIGPCCYEEALKIKLNQPDECALI